MLEKKCRVKILSIILFILSIGSISWIVYGNEVRNISYSIQEELIENSTLANLSLTVVSSSNVKEVTKIVLPDKTVVEKQANIMYQVEENGEYQFIVHYVALENQENGEILEVEREEIIKYQEVNILDKEITEVNDIEQETIPTFDPEEIVEEVSEIPSTPPKANAGVEVIIDEINFPDTTFRNWLLDKANINGYGVDGKLSYDEISNIIAIQVNGRNIESLKGIEHFTALESLLCVNNKIAKLDVRKNTSLRYLYCSANKLTELDITQNKLLVDLRCNQNYIRELNVSQNPALIELLCGDNQLSTIDVSKNLQLLRLTCEGNRLTTLNLSYQSNLKTVTMDRQKIEIPMTYSSGSWKSDVAKKYSVGRIYSSNIIYNSALGQFSTSNTNDRSIIFATNCNDAKGTVYSITGTLDFQYAGVELNPTNFPDATFRNWLLNSSNIHGYGMDNVLTTNELANIKEIDVRNRGITDIKGIEYFTALNTLYCQENRLSALDLTQNIELEYLYCNNNQLTALYVTNHTKLIEIQADNQEVEIEMNFKNNQWQSDTIYEISQIDTSAIFYDETLKQCIATDANTTSASFITNCQDGNGIVHIVSGVLKFTYQGIEINETNFPDTNFRVWLLDAANINGYGVDKVITNSEIQNITSIDVNQKGIFDLQGIEFFTSLTFLDCYGNNLSTLDVSKNIALNELRCYSNQLIALDVSNNLALERLHCVSNQITTLDVSKNSLLEYFYCSDNKLTEIDVSKNLVLKDLRCDKNLLKELNISQNTSLTCLICNDNQLTRLDISKNPGLIRLYCEKNQLTTLNLSKQQKLLEVLIGQQKITVPLHYKDKLWQSDATSKYELGNIGTNTIIYNSKLGQFSTTNTITKSTTFTTNCVDSKGVTYTLTGTLEFIYDGFVPVTNIQDVPKLIKVGETLVLDGTVEPKNATEKNISWSIKNDGGTGAVLTNNSLVIKHVGIVDVIATIYGGTTTGNYVQEFKIITLQEPNTLVSIPSSITLEKVKNDEMFEAVKEESISILSSTDTDVYSDNFYVQTDPIFHLIHTEHTDEWFTAQVFDKSDMLYNSKDTPLIVLNETEKNGKFFIKIYKDIVREKGIYEGTMNFIIGYGSIQ